MTVTVNVTGIDETVSRLRQYQERVKQKKNELCNRLASLGATNVSILFSRAFYTGDNDFTVTVEESNGGYVIAVSGQSVAFVEFGAGITYGSGHPMAAQFGAGPGTYPGQKHAFDPKGWYLPKEKRAADGTKHTYGNPPAMPMYNTVQELKQEMARVAREVFSS